MSEISDVKYVINNNNMGHATESNNKEKKLVKIHGNISLNMYVLCNVYTTKFWKCIIFVRVEWNGLVSVVGKSLKKYSTTIPLEGNC